MGNEDYGLNNARIVVLIGVKAWSIHNRFGLYSACISIDVFLNFMAYMAVMLTSRPTVS